MRSLGVALGALGFLPACGGDAAQDGAGGSGRAHEYVASETCAECHAQQYELWSNSHHDLAMQPATDETVLGDFDDAVFTHFGVETRFTRSKDGFHVQTEGPDGEPRDYRVGYTFGVEPLQQYLIGFPDGRQQCLSVAWDTERDRWFHLYPEEQIPPADELHWTGRYQAWNTMCAECHSTQLEKRYDVVTDTFDTTWHEIDVGCQACHGPGGEHVAWARSAAPSGLASPTSAAARGLAIELRREASAAQIDACAPCHSRRVQIDPDYVHGDPFLGAFVPERLVEGLYHPDGQIQEEVYVYGSFVQSRMHLAGVACSDCHDPHSLKLLAPANALCTQCHSPLAPRERFPTLQAKSYDTPEHHFHPNGTAGAACVACHMPTTTYMQVDPRRDHSFRIPRPDQSLAFGTPNACSGCHTERDAAWAVAELAARYGEKDADTDARGASFVPALAGARRGDRGVLPGLLRVAADAERAPLVRATAWEALPAAQVDGRDAWLAATRDESPLVRAAAARGFVDPRDGEALDALIALLDDPMRSVRIEAARWLAPLAMDDPADRTRRERGLAEYEAAQRYSGDMPWAHLNLGRLREEQGDADGARGEYERSLALDPAFTPVRFNLATLLNVLGQNDAAERVLRDGIVFAPAEGELHNSLGLLLAEEQRLEEAAAALTRAATLLPDYARVHYNRGLALQRLERTGEAEGALQRSYQIEPNDPDVLRALAFFYAERKDAEQAERFLSELEARRPGDPWIEGLRGRLQERGP